LGGWGVVGVVGVLGVVGGVSNFRSRKPIIRLGQKGGTGTRWNLIQKRTGLDQSYRRHPVTKSFVGQKCEEITSSTTNELLRRICKLYQDKPTVPLEGKMDWEEEGDVGWTSVIQLGDFPRNILSLLTLEGVQDEDRKVKGVKVYFKANTGNGGGGKIKGGRTWMGTRAVWGELDG